jgi:hypothetical protein
MMRSWGNRADTAVCDEPLYAHYLLRTGIDHPGAEEVIAAHEADWRKVVDGLVGDIPGGKTIYYQKHMTHHLLPEIDRGWLGRVTNAFLIRDPREMLTSLVRNVPKPTLQDTGLPQQVEIFEWVRERNGHVPPVVDARDVLEDPRGILTKLCDALGVAFDEAMLSWPPGPRPTDGVWAKYWYEAVDRTSTFQPYRPKNEAVPGSLRGLFDECLGHYETLHRNRLLSERSRQSSVVSHQS